MLADVCKRSQQVTTCWVLRWDYKGLWAFLHLRRHVDFLFACICGYVACIARAPAQHCWMCCANERNIVGPRFDDRETIEMLALVGSEVWPVSNFIQQLPTSRNDTQQHTTWCANARNMLGPTMLRAFARALNHCFQMLLGTLHIPKNIWNNGLYSMRGQAKCIMGNVKIANRNLKAI